MRPLPGKLIFLNLDPLTLLPSPPPKRAISRENVDLSVKDLNWLNTHPIRLSPV